MGVCQEGTNSCYKYGQTCHFQNECPFRKQGDGGGRAQPPFVTPQNRGNQRGSTSGADRGTNHLYAMGSRQDQENSPDVVTGMLRVFSFDVYALLDPGATLSFVTPYLATKFEILPEHLLEPFSVSTPVGESILVEKVYRNCIVSIHRRDTMDDLVELNMVDFDIILGMDWLYACYASVDCRTRIVKFQFPNEPIIEWRGSPVAPKGKIISYLKVR